MDVKEFLEDETGFEDSKDTANEVINTDGQIAIGDNLEQLISRTISDNYNILVVRFKEREALLPLNFNNDLNPDEVEELRNMVNSDVRIEISDVSKNQLNIYYDV